jgi:hypothetical protein
MHLLREEDVSNSFARPVEYKNQPLEVACARGVGFLIDSTMYACKLGKEKNLRKRGRRC